MTRPLEPHDGSMRRYRPDLSLHAGPGDLQVPVCTFDAPIRTIALDDPVVAAMFDAAFPAFKAGANHYRQYDVAGCRYRRYAGPAATLDARSYFSVARWSGKDDGGLVREIFAYTEPAETGVVMIDDMSDPRDVASINRKYGFDFASGDFLLLFVHEPERLRETSDTLRAVPRALPHFYMVPCVTRRYRLDNVVDLRLPDVQRWFFDTFSREAWLNIHVPLPPVSSFHELLCVMLGQHRGGNAMTQAVGRELRIGRIGGLVYPSARCDSAVVVENDHIVDWYGWNLIDYHKTLARSGGESDPLAAVSVTTMADSADLAHGAAYFGLPWGQFKVQLADEGDRRGSWQVIGLETLNVRRWMAALSPPQRQLLGLPENVDLIESRTDGLDDAERRLRAGYQALTQIKGQLAIDLAQLRHLLGRLARVLVQVPGGSRTAIDIDVVDRKLGPGVPRDAFVQAATFAGVLVEEPQGYLRFDGQRTLDYFTTVP